MKNALIKFINSFCYSIAIVLIVQLIVMSITGKEPMLPEYMAKFDSTLKAFAVELLLIGILSGVAGAGTEIFELKKPGLVVQSILYLLMLLAVWIPIGGFLWEIFKYPQSAITTMASMLLTYACCWIIQYKICARNIKEINSHLLEGSEDNGV